MIARTLPQRAHSRAALTLSSSDLEQLVKAAQLLVSPLEHATVDDWRGAVNRHLRDMLGADSAGFFLPVTDGLMMYSEEHDAESLAAYPDIAPPSLSDGTSIFEQVLRLGVATLQEGYGRDYHHYIASEYYNDYAGANGAHDSLTAAVPLGRMPGAISMLQFWHARPDGRQFGDREAALLRLLFPAFRAGVETHVRWHAHRADLLTTIDTLGHAVLVGDAAGRVLHETPALGALLATDPEADMLRAELLAAMHGMRTTLQLPESRSVTAPALPVLINVQTAGARYLLRTTLYGAAAGAATMVLVSLERQTPMPLSEAQLRVGFGLTRAEVRVATLIACGRSNAEIARELTISPHTARRHTERILLKLQVRSRAEVGAKLFHQG